MSSGSKKISPNGWNCAISIVKTRERNRSDPPFWTNSDQHTYTIISTKHVEVPQDCTECETPKPTPKPICYWRQNWPSSNMHAYVMSSVLKLETMVLIKLSLMITARIDLQSLAFSPSRRQIDSRASFTSTGGFAIERTSTRCCLLIDFTAIQLSTAKQKHKTSFSNTKGNSAYTETAKSIILLGQMYRQQAAIWKL